MSMISTYYGDKIREVKTKQKEEKEKPVLVLDYIQNMIGSDLKDQLLHAYVLERKKMIKWYTRMFRRLCNAIILNSMVICRANSQEK
jgi:5'-3' exonuclease